MTSLLSLSILSWKGYLLITKSISILDSNKRYLDSFNNYIDSHSGLNLKASIFTDIDTFKSFLNQKTPDIILFSTEFLDAIFELNIPQEKLFILSEDLSSYKSPDCKVEKTDNTKSISTIYKYQSIEDILHIIFSTIDTSNCYDSHSCKSAKMIGVYSPVKRSGRTSFSIALANRFSQQGKCLFVSFDEYTINNFDTSVNYTSKNISDLLFYYLDIFSDSNNDSSSLNNTFIVKAKSVIRTINGTDMIPACCYSTDIRALDTNHMISFLRKLFLLDYDFIVVDFADVFQDIISILSVCDEVYCPTTSDNLSQIKIDSFYKQACEKFPDFYTNFFQTITLPVHNSCFCDTSSDYFFKVSVSALGDFANSIIGRNTQND